MKKSINPRAIAIQNRFFEALTELIDSGELSGLQPFCEKHALNRTKYSCIKNSIGKPLEDTTYKMIDIDALAALCGDYNISPEWLLLGVGGKRRNQRK